MRATVQMELHPITLIADEPIDDLDRDHLGLMPWAKTIAGAIIGTPGPFTIGVHGDWGYGKTTLLKLAKRLIEEHQEDVVTVWFNAWQYEREEHPLLPLVAAVASQIKDKSKTLTKEKAANAPTVHALRQIGLSLRALARGMKFHGEVGMPLFGRVGVEFDSAKALEAEERLGKKTNPLWAEMFYHSAFESLGENTHKSGVKIVVFIDDLDRCHPDKAMFLLENIKLVLSQPGFVFVLAVDIPIIQSHLKKRYAEYCGENEQDRGLLYLLCAAPHKRYYVLPVIMCSWDLDVVSPERDPPNAAAHNMVGSA